MKKIIAGVDEVGRGSLVGPVYAAATENEEIAAIIGKITSNGRGKVS